MKAVIIIFLVVMISLGDCKTCENIPTIKNFDMQRFSGPWVSRLESADPRLPCLHYNLADTGNKTMSCTFLPYGLVANAAPINSNDITQGFKLAMSLPLVNGATWNIAETDYTSYAAIFTCKEADGVSYHSATIWSRPGNFVSLSTILKLKTLYSNYNIDTSMLLPIVPQTPSIACLFAERIIPQGLALIEKASAAFKKVV